MTKTYEQFRALTEKVVGSDKEGRRRFADAKAGDEPGDDGQPLQAAFIRALVDELDTPERR